MEVPRSTRILMLCDWLPRIRRGRAVRGRFRDGSRARGHDVALVGFSSRASGCVDQPMGDGRLRVRQVYRPTYDRANLLSRAWWTLGANVALLWGARRELWRCDEVRFTGSPPYLLHFIMPLALALRIRTRYRITDFHPECLVAALGRNPWWLRVVGQITGSGDVGWTWSRCSATTRASPEGLRRRNVACGAGGDSSPGTSVPTGRPPSPPRRRAGRSSCIQATGAGP